MKLISALLIAGLVAVNTALGFAAWELSSSPLREPGISPAGQNPDIGIDMPSIGNDLQTIDVAVFTELAARPPFSSSRRPKVVAPAPKVRQAPVLEAVIEPLRAELVGVAIDNNRKKALIRVQSEQGLRILEYGDQIGGWRLAVIEETRVVFEQDTEQKELLLRPKP